MIRMWHGIRAVTVELLGVLLVVWMLFGFTALGLHSASGQPPTLSADLARQFETWRGQIKNRLTQHLPPESQREQFVANRLTHYSRSYSQAARNHLDELFAVDSEAANRLHGASAGD
jgi:hypothetical protein